MAMALHELDSFVRKFVSLWQSGCDASLQMRSEAGHAFINLQLGLGQAKVNPCAAGSHRGGGPSRQRRREHREAERQERFHGEKAKDVVAEQAASAKAEQAVLIEAEKATKPECEKENPISEEVIVRQEAHEIERAENAFECELCDFKSNWKNWLQVHMARKHSTIEQLDGNISISDKKLMKMKNMQGLPGTGKLVV